MPKLTIRPEKPESQLKSGLRLTLATADYKIVPVNRTRLVQFQPSFGQDMMVSPNDPANVFVNEITESSGKVEPDRVKFLVTINNQMPRVFHGGGTVVQFKVAGKVMPVDQAGYAELQNAIVPPGSEQQVTILGPAIGQMPPSGTIGVFFYDVVMNQNDAGVVVEKQNFEWFYDYTTEARTVQGAPAQTKAMRMTPQGFAAKQRELELRQGLPAEPPQP